MNYFPSDYLKMLHLKVLFTMLLIEMSDDHISITN